MFQTIDCARLDFDDTTFLMSYPLEAPSVTQSAAAIGVVHPIVVAGCPCHGKYQIIAGFRRAHAFRRLGIKMIHANIQERQAALQPMAFDLALRENLSHRRFNHVEKALILSKLSTRFAWPQEVVIRDYLPLLDLAPNEKVLNVYLKLWNFDEELKGYIACHDLPLTLIELLAGFSSNDRRSIFLLISELKVGVNKLKELLNYLEEISLRDERTISTILASQEIRAILTDQKHRGPQRIDALRAALRTQRFPRLSRLESQYQETLQRLKPSCGIRLTTDRIFEDDSMNAAFRFSSPEELKTAATELLRLSETPELDTILRLIRGEVTQPLSQ